MCLGYQVQEAFVPVEIFNKLAEHILSNARKKNLYIDRIGGYLDHVHTLISLSSDISMAKTIQLIKGESAHWMNRQRIIHSAFEWQDEYYAVSVSPDQVDRVRAYIENQVEHHRKKTFEEEIEEIMRMQGSEAISSIGLKPPG